MTTTRPHNQRPASLPGITELTWPAAQPRRPHRNDSRRVDGSNDRARRFRNRRAIQLLVEVTLNGILAARPQATPIDRKAKP